jgi:hypothetical protein
MNELLERRRLLIIRKENLLKAVEQAYKKPTFKKNRDKYFSEIVLIKKEIEKINKKIDFAMNLDRMLKDEEINKSNSDNKKDQANSMGTR